MLMPASHARQVPRLFQSPNPRRPVYFSTILFDQAEADQLWRYCIKRLLAEGQTGRTGFEFRVGNHGPKLQLYVLIGKNDRLFRFWVREVISNDLVLVGNEEGMFPLDVEGLHG